MTRRLISEDEPVTRPDGSIRTVLLWEEEDGRLVETVEVRPSFRPYGSIVFRRVIEPISPDPTLEE